LDVVAAVGRTFGADVLQPHGGTFRGSRRQNLLLVRGGGLRAMKQVSDWLNPRVRTLVWLEGRQFAAEPPPEVIAISRMVRRDMQEFYRVPDERLHLVYNGVDVKHFSPEACRSRRDEARDRLGLAESETCFLLVAHNFKLKGVRELVESAGFLHGDRAGQDLWRIVVVGKENPRPYQRLAERLGCAGRIHFVGPAADVLPAYAAADVYVHPTWYDPCSLVVLEALACGLPVITTRFNGAGELIEDGREGFVLDSPADVGRLAETMERLLAQGLREPMGEAARRTAEQYPIERNFREMLEVFTRVADSKEVGA
ncbi:MAG: glycosyltransferase family 4 protein, partial [Phycisphaerae bacterium]